MKRFAFVILAVAVLFSGCAQSREDPFKVDTVVLIPVDPTEEPTEESTAIFTEASAEEVTEVPTEEPTEPEETEAKKTTTASKSSTTGSSKKSSSSSSSKKSSSSKTENKSKETESKSEEAEPEETEAVETEPPVIETEKPTEPPFDPSSYEIGILEYDILDELNANRTNSDTGELVIDQRLSGIAWLRAKEASFSWSHTRPDGSSFKSALSDYGYGYSDAVELMVYTSGGGDAQTFVGKWMASETHSANILSDEFATVGIGAYDENGVTYVVCLLVG